MVWHSTADSIAKNKVSIFAIIEIVISIVFTWWIAWYFDTYLHLVISVLIAPLLLFRSRQSTRYALHFFAKNYNNQDKQLPPWKQILVIIPISIISYVCTSYISPYILDSIVWSIIYGMFLLGVVVVGVGVVVVGVVVLYTNNIKNKIIHNLIMFLLLPMWIGIFIGIVIMTVIYKIYATLKYIRYGYKNILTNYNKNNFVVDIWHTPEILPDIEKCDFINSKLKISQIFKCDDNFIIQIISLVVFYPSAIIYRYSLKSTFWFYYLPILFFVNKPDVSNSQKIEQYLSSFFITKISKIGFRFSFMILLAFVFTHFVYQDISQLFDSRIYLLTVVNLIDFSNIKVYNILLLAIAFLGLYKYFYADYIYQPIKASGGLFEYNNKVKIVVY